MLNQSDEKRTHLADRRVRHIARRGRRSGEARGQSVRGQRRTPSRRRARGPRGQERGRIRRRHDGPGRALVRTTGGAGDAPRPWPRVALHPSAPTPLRPCTCSQTSSGSLPRSGPLDHDRSFAHTRPQIPSQPRLLSPGRVAGWRQGEAGQGGSQSVCLAADAASFARRFRLHVAELISLHVCLMWTACCG